MCGVACLPSLQVYREGDLISPPARGIQTTLVPAGGATVVELVPPVPGNLTLVDHSIFRIDKGEGESASWCLLVGRSWQIWPCYFFFPGAVGFLKVQGRDPRADIYASAEMPQNCPNCKLHN